MPAAGQRSVLSPAAVDLGFGGDALAQETAETAEELRKKRMLEMQQAGGFGAAAQSLLGGSRAGGY